VILRPPRLRVFGGRVVSGGLGFADPFLGQGVHLVSRVPYRTNARQTHERQ
jgi:hypothetical protein